MTWRQVRLNEAYSHLGWKSLPHLEIYDGDDTADYSQLLKRIGHGLVSASSTVCVCVHEGTNGTSALQICL